jgi:hypothetical protein
MLNKFGRILPKALAQKLNGIRHLTQQKILNFKERKDLLIVLVEIMNCECAVIID